MAHSRLFFDRNDYTLLRIVNDVLHRSAERASVRTLLDSCMHPHGIKEMAAPGVLRVAYAIASLLGTLEGGKASERLSALRSLRDEILFSNTFYLQKNTSRVLLQIMKELVRHRDDEQAQLRLAHDFRMASSGKPRVVRAELEKYHLLEMPEEWNQLAFDHHVHDANTKGRKSPTHLVMDAWIKGIRFLTVVYYNYVDAEVASELLEAARILDVHIRIGIEVVSRFRGKYVRVIWEPQSYTDPKSFQSFLEEQPVRAFMNEGRQVSAYQQRYVFEALTTYNGTHRAAMGEEYGLELDELDEAGFRSFVGTGQPSLLHLAKYIQSGLQPRLKQAAEAMAAEYENASPERRRELENRLAALNAIDSDLLVSRYLQPCRNPDLHDPTRPQDGPEVPPLLRLHIGELLPRLATFHSSSHFTLNLSNLSTADTLEILYDCQGHVSNIELYNLKDVTRGKWSKAPSDPNTCPGDVVDLVSPERTFAQISELQKALNEDNVIALKRAIRGVIWSFEEDRLILSNTLAMARTRNDLSRMAEIETELWAMDERKDKLLDILFDIENFHRHYKLRPLGSRIGSGSTGQSRHQYGMGVVVLETLPKRAQGRPEPGWRAAQAPARDGPNDHAHPHLLPLHGRRHPDAALDPQDSRTGTLRVRDAPGVVPGLHRRAPQARRQHRHPGRRAVGARQRPAPDEAAGQDNRAPVLPVHEHRPQERSEDPDGFHPGLPDLRPDQGLVGPGLPGRFHLVRHHGHTQRPAGRAGGRGGGGGAGHGIAQGGELGPQAVEQGGLARARGRAGHQDDSPAAISPHSPRPRRRSAGRWSRPGWPRAPRGWSRR